MLTEVDYLDSNGSVCWFCGQPLNIDKLKKTSYVGNVKVKTYLCSCPQGHLSFIQQSATQSQFDLNITMHYFIDIDDYFEHVGLKFKLLPDLHNKEY